MSYTLTKQEKETTLLYNQGDEPVIISTYDLALLKHLAKYAANHPDHCQQIST